MSLTCQYGNCTSQIMTFFYLNVSALITFIRTWVLFITHLSTVSNLTNQIIIPASDIMDGQHQNKYYRLPCLFCAPFHARLTSLADRLFHPTPRGSLFTGYPGDLFPEQQSAMIIILFPDHFDVNYFCFLPLWNSVIEYSNIIMCQD